MSVSDSRIPALPDPSRVDDGYDWMAAIEAVSWRAIPSWRGELLGDWPFAVVGIYLVREEGVYGGIALWLEGGDVELTTHTTREDFRDRLDEIQARHPGE
ncbi:hypothetical protein AGRA3207_000193 [Actinomadura graeca]|uniref:Uncharacterized protein n=1 Tax=Actinomadura graeca TaxID=2750812 RepID=A0ABX8QMQ1_9ACTN|nr:hypothetical protein [Actinomadura graeca]QXJ19631.1 hypothetical protein AGRA3207_000193 [Actinomadura graeca]